MMLALLFVVAGDVDFSPVVDVRRGCVELNHYYDEQGKHIFDQVIWWSWCEVRQEYAVCDWRIVKHQIQHPRRHHGGWRTMVWDGERLLLVVSRSRRISWTQHDPELHDRDKTPQNERIGIGGRKK